MLALCFTFASFTALSNTWSQLDHIRLELVYSLNFVIGAKTGVVTVTVSIKNLLKLMW